MSIINYLLEGLSSNVNFEQSENGNYLGYKVMGYDGKNLISGANSKITLPATLGAIHAMPGGGIFLSNESEYVVDYYSYKEDENDPDEVVIQYEFSLGDVVTGENRLGDKQPEIGVSKAKIVQMIPIDDWHNGTRFK